MIKNFASPVRPYDTDSAICCPNNDDMAIGRYPFLNSDENGLGNSMLLCLLTVALANNKFWVACVVALPQHLLIDLLKFWTVFQYCNFMD